MRIDDFILARIPIMSSTHTPHALNRGDSGVTELICSTGGPVPERPLRVELSHLGWLRSAHQRLANAWLICRARLTSSPCR
ncbi:hypothetical protein FFM54_04910 [Burkholderia pseudomallei]|nr:hypothetical protein CF649_33505 [Burkholderia sp. 136(2017)]PNX24222.1 hypothetical protein CF647_33520 [Burkholderia sp. 117]PNX30993.1 hypothetical protein CF648_33510 [Burkholderia sp. 137]QCU49183.1 hypothetical protein FFM54_04910 [Burkholderia pseudomallei]